MPYSPILFKISLFLLPLMPFDVAIAQNVESLANRARINLYQTWNFDSSEYYWGKIIDQEDTPAFAYADYGWYLMIKQNGQEKGLSYIRKAVDMAPDEKQMLTWYGWALMVKDVDESKIWIDKALDLDPEYGEALQVSARIAAIKNNKAQAIMLADLAAQKDPTFRCIIPLIYAEVGDREKAIQWIDNLSEKPKGFDLWLLMETYGALKMDREALDYLQKSFDARFPYVPWIDLIPGVQHLYKYDEYKAIKTALDLP